mmetsp:Transcript_69037/g.186548  ORF Transcript_69037/g.186548 Transcript_69037/m.186548 type:complete len:305 (-) Transcript_69037:249-1163(-)
MAQARGAPPLLLGLALLCRPGAGAIWSPGGGDSPEARSGGRLIRPSDPPPRSAQEEWSLEVGPSGEVARTEPGPGASSEGALAALDAQLVEVDEDSPATASPVPSWRCKDSLTTGIRFHGGGSASCRELYNYCNHKTLDAHIRARCPMTCGACTPFLVKQVSNSSDSSSRSSAPSGPCEDDAADHVPVLFMGRKVMDCIDSKVFCFGHPNSKYIAKKCRATCGVCEVADAELEEADKMEPITTTLATVVAAAEPDPNYEGFDGPSCSRRRRWGLCSSRRRDGAPGDPAADSADPSHAGHNWEPQ